MLKALSGLEQEIRGLLAPVDAIERQLTEAG